jgi:hypothetical protein
MGNDFNLIDPSTAKLLSKLDWMRERHIWPNGKRYLWTDAFGVVLMVSLYRRLNRREFIDQAEWVVADVERVLGRRRGIRIGEAEDRDGQYFHYLAMWIFALTRLGGILFKYRAKAIQLVKDIHPAFVLPGRGVQWKMLEDLSAPYPGYGLGSLDSFHAYVVYRLLDEEALAAEIRQMKTIAERTYDDLVINQDLGLGMMLWMSSFFPSERWAHVQRERSLAILERLWIDPPGYFCRELGASSVKFAFTNYGVSLGLQAVEAWPDRVALVNSFFETYRSGDEYDSDAITHVMACVSSLPGEFLPPRPNTDRDRKASDS